MHCNALVENSKDPIPEIFPKAQQPVLTLFLKSGK